MKTADLSIKLIADIADVQRKMLEAQKSVNGAMANISKAANQAKMALAGLAAGLSVGAFAQFIKGAIDSADEAAKLAQKTGIAVQNLAGLQLAFRQSGLDAGALQSSMSKLSNAIVNGNDALKALGIQTQNADGSLKSTRDVLGQVADRFAGYRDGVEKTALANELFGNKLGATMIPLLNGGAAALEEYDRVAQQLGLTLDERTAKAAERFNDTLDLIGQGVQGIGAQVAARLLPTLQSLAERFLTGMTTGNRMKNMVDALATSLKALYAVGIVLVEVFTTVVKTLESATRMFMAIFRGEFKEAHKISAEWANYIQTEWPKTLADAKGAFEDTGGAAVDSMAAIGGATQKAAPLVGEIAKKAKDARVEFEALMSRITGKDAGLDGDFFKNLNTLKAGFDKAYISLDQYVQLVETYIKQQKFYQDQLKAESDLLKEIERDGEERAKQREKEIEDRAKQIKSVEDMVEQLRFEVDALTMTNEEREIAIKLRELENKGIAQGTEEYAKYAEQIREAVTAKEATEASIKQQQEYAKQFEKISDQIGQGLTNALIQGGKSASEYIKNLFRTMVLRPLLEPIIRGGVGAVMGSLGMGAPGTAAAAEGAGGGAVNVLTVLNNGYNVIKNGFSSMTGQLGAEIRNVADFFIQSSNQTISQFGQALYRGSESLASAAGTLGNAAAAYGIQKFLSGGYKIGNGVVVDVLTAVGGAFFGPIAGVVGAVVNRAFGRKLTQAGIMGNFGGDAGFAGSNYKFEKGGWFRSDKTSTSPLDPAVQNALAQQFLAIQGSMQAMSGALGGVADTVDTYTKRIKVNLKGLSQEKAQAKLQQIFDGITEELALIVLRDIGLAELQAQGIDTNITRLVKKKPVTSVNTALLDEYVAGFARVGETSAQTLQRLSGAISVVNQAFDSLGYSMMQASLAGADMASKITEAFGGVENFTKAIDAYYSAFYTEAERTATLTRQLTETFTNMGLTLPGTREAFRSLVESQDLTTESGRNLFAALVQLAPTFASVVAETQAVSGAVDDMTESLRSAADIANERASLERELLTLQGDTIALLEIERNAINEANRDLFDRIQTLKAEQAATQAAADAAVEAERVRREAQDAADAVAESQRRAIEAAMEEQMRIAAAIAGERIGLENQLLQLQGDTVELRRRELSALDPSNRELQERIWQIQDEQQRIDAQRQAAEEQARVVEQIAQQRIGLENQLLQLQGDTAALRARELAELDPSNRELQQRIWQLQDEQAILEESRRIAQERETLERELLQLQGDAAALLAIERSAVSEQNRNLFDRIESLKAEKAAAEAAAQAQERYVSALTDAASSIADEIARLRGVNRASPIALEADFALLTAAARAGDASAAGKLAGVSQSLSEALAGSATSALDIARTNARLAASLDQTLNVLTGYGAAAPDFAASVSFSGASAFSAPPAVYSAASGASSDSAASELRALREEQRAQSSALIGLQNRMTRLLEQWDGDGLPETRSVSA